MGERFERGYGFFYVVVPMGWFVLEAINAPELQSQ
jgi:hypothetical protein